MSVRLGLVHATLAAVAPMVEACRRVAPGVTLLHFLDEGLLPLAEREGLSANAIGELERLVARAVASGVDGVLLTCSTFSPAVRDLRSRCAVPLESVDEAMLGMALQHGSRLGVVATVAPAGPTTAGLLREMAAEAGRTVEVAVAVVPEAFSALRAGDTARHDALVQERIATLAERCDAIVLAQISMARAAVGAAAGGKPLLTSPETSLRHLVARLSR